MIVSPIAAPSEAASAALAHARDIAPQLREFGKFGEEHRHLAPESVALLADAKFFHLFVPTTLGGLGLDLIGGLDVIEEVSAADAATGWCLLKVSSTNMFSASFPVETAKEIWTSPAVVAAGSLNPKGRAVRTATGYRLTGRWDWGTASPFADWLMGGGFIFEDGADAPTMGPFGPEMRTFFFPAAAAELIDTWHTNGMRGTGSGDFAVHDLEVPERFAFSPMMAPPPEGELFKVPSFVWMMVPHASVALGIARAAINELIELSKTKTPLASSKLLKDKEWVQDAIARATALVESSRAYLYNTVRDVWSQAADPSRFVHLSLASTHATHSCVEAVDLMVRAAGGSAVYTSSPLQRHWRDIHVAASHYLVNIEKFAGAGRAILDPMVSPIGPT
jgi:indole-3-acetate monooxygenase